MNKYLLVILSVTGGILSGLAWSSWCTGLILLVAFVPFFLIENHFFENQGKYGQDAFFIYILIGFIIFNTISLGWIRAVSIVTAVSIIICMSVLMSFIVWLAHIVRKKAGNIPGSIALISFWLAFEFLSLNSMYLSPWVNIGNGLAKDILFIQWYEATGVAGGTLWILLSNLLLSLALVNSVKNKRRAYTLIWLAVIIIPSIISLTRYYTIKESETNKNEVVIIQPNIDPYTEKFSVPFDIQLKKVLTMAEDSVTEKTCWLITPETTVDDPINEEDLANNKYIKSFGNFALEHPGTSIISGLVSFRLYSGLKDAPTNSARKIDSTGFYYDHFNSAFKIDTGEAIVIYHKSKLVTGIETQFSSGLGRLANKILPDLGGTKWGYGAQEERTCFEHPVTKQVIAPIICFESVFGNYVADYVRKGAEALIIITNDGWWKNTNGYKQHLSYASIRAIETRRPVARAANTGVSCIIDIRGRRTLESNWWTSTALKGEISSETVRTPYVLYGDYIMKFFSAVSVMVLLYVFIALPLRKKIRFLH
ncbi:MAG: apolipoprotein N-acyltransferase [Bacteroidia bacterium]|nr:apolipoprotein N-acyltransferase [Bacteroidia bacterium]